MLKYRICVGCGKEFIPNTGKQIYCDKQCRDRVRSRAKRAKRKEQGLCPQCGKPMPKEIKGTHKKYVSYCEDCKEYYKKRYNAKKGQKNSLTK